jgi:hypothetical protein
VVAAAVALAMPWRALVGVFYDDGHYAVLARALAEGRGYRFLHLPGAPAAVHYPPGWPFLLSLLWRAVPSFPDNVALLRSANVVLLGAAAAVAAAYLAPRLGLGRWGAAALLALGCTAVPLLAVATVLFSEPLFLVLLAGACWAADAASRAAPRRAGGLAALAGLLAGAAALTRSIGVAVAAGVVLALLLRRRRLAAAAAALPAAAMVLPWQLWVRAHRAAVDPLIASNYGTYGDIAGQGGLQLSAASLADLARPLGAITLPPAGPLVPLLAAPALAVLVLGVAALVRRAPALGLSLLAYLVIVGLWPYGTDRFLWAVLPLLAPAFAAGAADLWRLDTVPARRRWARILVIAGVLPIAAGFAWHQARALPRGAATAAQRGISARLAPVLPWIRAETDTAAVIAGEDEALLWLYGGRRAVPNYLWRVRGRSAEDLGPDSLRAWLEKNRVDWVVLSGRGSDAAPAIDGLIARAPGMLRLVRVWPEGPLAFAVLRTAAPTAVR